MKIDDAEAAKPGQLVSCNHPFWKLFGYIGHGVTTPGTPLPVSARVPAPGCDISIEEMQRIIGNIGPSSTPVTGAGWPDCNCGNDKLEPGPYHLTTCERWRAGK